MKIGLLGYGKMGREIESIALERGHTVTLKVDIHNRSAVTEADIKGCDVLIDFSTPGSVLENIQFVLNAHVPMVVGTTGWYDSIQSIASLCEKQNGKLIYGSNFSLGVNIFFALNKYLAHIMNQYLDYKPSVHEIHHTEKLDAPSGTAITLGNDILEKIERLKQWTDKKSSDSANLSITSDRIDNVPGTHIVSYSSYIDTIELKHTAHNRKGFALGAVVAAEWIVNKNGFFEIKSMFNF